MRSLLVLALCSEGALAGPPGFLAAPVDSVVFAGDAHENLLLLQVNAETRQTPPNEAQVPQSEEAGPVGVSGATYPLAKSPLDLGGSGEVDLNSLGVPGVNFPIFGEVPSTGFDCAGRQTGGYYADTRAGCQAYHICVPEAHTSLHSEKQVVLVSHSYLCPNGTLYDEAQQLCDWWYNVPCESLWPRSYPYMEVQMPLQPLRTIVPDFGSESATAAVPDASDDGAATAVPNATNESAAGGELWDVPLAVPA